MTSLLALWALIAACLSPALAAPGTEIALVLDTSGSMAFSSTDDQGRRYPPNDPERAAVLGALIVEGLVRGSADRLSVIGFPESQGAAPPVVTRAEPIRELPYVNHTLFKAPLAEARRRLDASDRDGKLLLFLTDGNPEDLPPGGDTAADAFGLGTAGEIDTFAIGLYGSDVVRDTARFHLDALARTPDDLALISDPADVVPAFTRGYARALGSRPETGTLPPGGSATFEVGRYVTEVLVFVASEVRGPAFSATLTGPGGAVPVQAAGDDGCGANARVLPPAVCGAPRRHYQVFRAASDPAVASSWTLSVDRAAAVRYGVILRYDLEAALAVDPTVRVGQSLPVEARLLFRGATFDDAAFFASDGFAVEARIGDELIPLTHAGGGRFTGTWTPAAPSQGALPAVVTFRNTWMEKRDRKQVLAEGFLPLTLRPTPSPLVLGSWRGGRRWTERCGRVSLAGSENADVVPVRCEVPALAEGRVTCAPQPDGATAQPLTWEVCVAARPCCGAVPAPGEALSVTFVGAHPHYASGAVAVPIDATVSPTGFLRCWWLPIALALGLAWLLFVIVGWIRPHGFDPGLSVKVAGSEKDLKRTTALVVTEQPGARRGFYRNARLCLDGEGNGIRGTRQAVIVVVAGPAGTTRWAKAAGLERRSRRTRKWEPVPAEELREGVVPGEEYRVGGLYFRFG